MTSNIPELKIKLCSKCGAETKVYSTFGKFKCKVCIDKYKTGLKGHSGMIYNKNCMQVYAALYHVFISPLYAGTGSIFKYELPDAPYIFSFLAIHIFL